LDGMKIFWSFCHKN